MKLSFFVGEVSIFDIGNISYPIIDNPLRQCILKPWCFAAVTRSFSQTISNQWRKNTLSKQLGKIPQTFGVQFDTYRSQILSLTLQYTKFILGKNAMKFEKSDLNLYSQLRDVSCSDGIGIGKKISYKE